MSAITTAPVQVDNGKAVHYVRKDAFHSHTIGCGRRVSRDQALEDYRSQAAAMLPVAVRDEQAARP
ncbi:hypothetical protein ACFWY6_17150 [Streptomyces sp. NPDC059037]|uniref:hypothetical protein n=1 Tax=Streptomyces sp. NPDC059037 TaxID=3346710 RepID=UPI0036D15673